MKSLNNTIQQFTSQVTSEAGTVFGAANSVFNNIMNAVGGIVKSGPSQLGFSTGELNALTAQNVQSSSAMARNLKGAAASSAAAIGGGNVATPSGATQAATQNAEIAAENQQATTQNQIQQADYATGRQNFWNSIGAEQQAPGVFGVSNQANEVAGSQQQTAMKSQQAIDTANNWWASDIMKLGTAAVGGFTSGLTGGLGKNLANSISGPGSPSIPSDTGGSGSFGDAGNFGGDVGTM